MSNRDPSPPASAPVTPAWPRRLLAHLPNALTVSRGACGPLVMALLFAGRNDLAFAAFLYAILTDLVDGWLARRLGALSRWATFVDPLSDKLLTDFAWTALAVVGWAPAFFAPVMIGRDLAIGVGFWRHVRRTGELPEARPIGQIAVAFEGTALCVLVFHGPWLDTHWPTVGTWLGALALALTAWDLLAWVAGRPRAA